MPRGPLSLPTQPLRLGPPSYLRDALNSSTKVQSVSTHLSYLNAYGMSKHVDGSGFYSDAPSGNPCPAIPIATSNCQELPGLSERQGAPKPTQSVPSVTPLQTCLARIRSPQNSEIEQANPHMAAPMGRNSIPVAVPWTTSNNFIPPMPSLNIPTPKDKLPSSEIAASVGSKRPHSTISTDKEQADAADAPSGPAKKHKVGLTGESAAGLQSPPAFKYEAKETNPVAPTQPVKLVAEKGLHALGVMCAMPGTAVLRATRTRLSASSQGEHVAAKMYFHPSKMAWRSELLVDGCKRQRSFSCKLYGFERARMMCEWSRNFVLRTARLPTEDETRDAIGLLMSSKFQTSNAEGALPPYTGWLYAYPPFETGAACSPRVDYQRAPADKQNNLPGNHSPIKHQAQDMPLRREAGVYKNPQRQPQLAPNASAQVDIHDTSAVRACTGLSNTGAHGADCGAACGLLISQKVQVNSSEAQAALRGREASLTAEAPKGQTSPEQPLTNAEVFAELGVLPMLKAKLKKQKRRKTGKKPHSGVRGMYIHQNAWKNIQEMKEQHLVARTFLRCVIEKNRQIYDSDGWSERVERLSKLAEASEANQLDTGNPFCAEPPYKPRTSSLSPNDPPVREELPSLRVSANHSRMEDQTTKRPSMPHEGLQQANCIPVSLHCARKADPDDHQEHILPSSESERAGYFNLYGLFFATM
ncbi:hypothetical protein, conserved [Eimeria praecox]|uniref:Uncharacterized protein n=1 Tax=Eimeria praecox TaxID=51316 RepID=U6H1D0_9EIME|nr:hypothetical protein, conserved [Eimeria praecox]